jgi:MoaA/NifB/PqqE/SkfB family radical SAM enzyme
MISLSVCATRSFISEENLWKYLRLAKEFGAGFIRIIEPRTTGNYTGKDVALTDEQRAILNNFYLRVNSYAAFRNFPIIMYPGYHQRLAGCFGAGDRYLYIDPKGDIHACPFCRGKAGNAVWNPLIPAIMNLRKSGCHEFERDSMIIS